jgi:hypothetical protein
MEYSTRISTKMEMKTYVYNKPFSLRIFILSFSIISTRFSIVPHRNGHIRTPTVSQEVSREFESRICQAWKKWTEDLSPNHGIHEPGPETLGALAHRGRRRKSCITYISID